VAAIPDKVATRSRRTQVEFGVWMFLAGAAVSALVVTTLLWGELRRMRAPGGPDPLRTPAYAYAWAAMPDPEFPIPPYAQYLAGVTIVVDPGHVGQRDRGGTWKRGPTGLREAEVNLRVARHLRAFLEAAGARVVLTRDEDRSLDLPDRADLLARARAARDADADLLISIHHNASKSPDANYTSVFYHSAAPQHPASLAAARHVLGGLSDALRLESHLPCGVLSDKLCFENGFAVLREANVPAILTEASFHSNPAEEQRLRDAVYNRREAYGIFLGLARWAQAGLPRIELERAEHAGVRRGQEIAVRLHDGLSQRGGWGADRWRILPDTVVVKVDGERVSATLDERRRCVRFRLPRTLRGQSCEVLVDFANVFGQHVGHPVLSIPVTP
jgi:N-acetylmuramoyl-L-alanine amidase